MALQSLSLPSKVDWRIKSNLVTLKDIRTRKRFWMKPYLNPKRTDNTGKTYYINPHFGLLPKYDKYNDDGTPGKEINPHGYTFIGNQKVLTRIENPTEEQKKDWVNYDYISLRIFPRWYFWQPDYWMLPEPDRWEQVIERTIGTIGRKDKSGKEKPAPKEEPIWDTLEDEDYYILGSGDNIMTIIIQNRKQYDWKRPDCVFFFGRNTFSPKGLQWKKDKAEYEIEWNLCRTGKKPLDKDGKEKQANDFVGRDMPLMFWVKSWRYINASTMFAEVVLEKCYIWQYFGNWMNTWYTAKINKSNLNNDHMSYSGLPIAVKNDPGKQIMDGQRPFDRHWPMDWDWYVIRPITEDDRRAETSNNPFAGEGPQADEVKWPEGLWAKNSILKWGAKEVPKEDTKEDGGWIYDSKKGEYKWEKAFPDGYIIDEGVAPAHHCPACDACFSFCGDLRLKKAMSPVEGGNTPETWKEKPIHASWQPEYCLGYTVFPDNLEKIVDPKLVPTVSVITDEKGNATSAVPSAIQIRRFKKGGPMLDCSPDAPTLLFLLDGEHDPLNVELLRGWFPDWFQPGKGSSAFKEALLDGLLISANAKRKPKNIRKYLWNYLPKCFRDQPHLLVHSTVQFYFQYKLLFTANCKHVWIRRKGAGFALGYRILVRSSISGILYAFESLDIFYKWEVKVRGSVVNIGLVNMLWKTITNKLADSALGAIASGAKHLAMKALAAAESLPVIGMFAKGLKGLFKGDDKAKALEKIAQCLEQLAQGGVKNEDAGSYGEKIGAVAKNETPKNSPDKAEQEAQTERRSKQTYKTMAREVYNSIFYSNTIDFSYDFWEYANRCVANPFMIRFEYSEILYNNLVNNNNAYPIQNYQIRGNRFCQIVKTGDFQADVNLGFDIKDRNLFRGLCARGITWYNEGTDWDKNGNIISDWFVPWVPRYKALQSYTIGASFNANTQQAAEDFTNTPGEDTKDTKTTVPPAHGRWICSMIGYEGKSTRSGDIVSREQSKGGWGGQWFGSRGHMGIFPKGNFNKDYFSELCAIDLDELCDGYQSAGWTFPADAKLTRDYPLPEGSYNVCWHTGAGIKTYESDDVNGFTLVIGDNALNLELWKGTKTPGKSERTVKGTVIEGIRGLQYAVGENKEPVWDDKNTNAGSGIGVYEPDKMPELDDPEKDPKETQFDKPEGETREKGGDVEKEFENELEAEREAKEQEKREREAQKEAEREAERERERDREKERTEERERAKEAEKARKEKEIKREQERQERERKAREDAYKKEIDARAEKKQKEKRQREKGK